MISDTYITSERPQRLRTELEWLINCPELTIEITQQAAQFRQRYLAIPNHTSASPCEDLTSFRLGRYFETLVHHALSASHQFERIEQNVILKEDKRTLGELDFLLFPKQDRDGITQAAIHLEVAIKFYLFDHRLDHSLEFTERLVGLDARDTLARKLKRLTEHQLQLLDKFPEHLAELELTAAPQHWLLIKGMLFFHLAHPTPELHSPLNSDCLKGWWITAEEIASLQTHFDQFSVHEKPDWMSIFNDSAKGEIPANAELLSFETLKEQLVNRRFNPIILAYKHGTTGPTPISCGFVVDHDWNQSE